MLINKKALAVSLLATIITSNVNAAGFALIENGASGLGNAYAGASAVAEDASTTYFNPAGLSKLEGQHFVFAGHYISTKAELSNNGSLNATGAVALSGANSDGGGGSFVPSFFYANKLNDKWTFGLGVTVPFGLGTEYDENWVGRYHAVKSEIHTLNINPSFSFKVNDKFSVGFGVNVQRIEATLSNKIDSVATCRALTTEGNCDLAGLTGANIGNVSFDSKQSLTGDDWSFGWNFGLMYNISKQTRLGLAYRSQVAHTLEGNVDFTVNANLQAIIGTSTFLSDTGISADLTVPESLSVSLSHNMSDKWQLLADVTWMKWERYNELVVNFANPIQPQSTSTPNYQNQLRYSVGATFKADSKKTYRMGLALDESAVRNADARTARSPGNDRTWLSLGLGYEISKTFGYDIGYTHLFISDTPINNNQLAKGKGILTGSYDQSVDILSAQFNWKF